MHDSSEGAHRMCTCAENHIPADGPGRRKICGVTMGECAWASRFLSRLTGRLGARRSGQGDDVAVRVAQHGGCPAIGFGVWRLLKLKSRGLEALDGPNDITADERQKRVGGEILVELEIAVAVCKDRGTGTALANRREAQFRIEVDRCLEVGDLEDELKEAKS